MIASKALSFSLLSSNGKIIDAARAVCVHAFMPHAFLPRAFIPFEHEPILATDAEGNLKQTMLYAEGLPLQNTTPLPRLFLCAYYLLKTTT